MIEFTLVYFTNMNTHCIINIHIFVQWCSYYSTSKNIPKTRCPIKVTRQFCLILCHNPSYDNVSHSNLLTQKLQHMHKTVQFQFSDQVFTCPIWNRNWLKYQLVCPFWGVYTENCHSDWTFKQNTIFYVNTTILKKHTWVFPLTVNLSTLHIPHSREERYDLKNK